MARDTVSIRFDKIVRESDSGKAVLVVFDGDDVWVPRSQFAAPESLVMGSVNVSAEVATWFAEKEGLIDADDQEDDDDE